MQGVDQAIDDTGAILFGGGGQMGVTRSGGGTGMAEQGLDMPQAQTVFEQVGGEGMAQGVNRGFFLMPQSASITFIAACTPPRSMGVTAR